MAQFVERLLQKEPDSAPLLVLLGHFNLLTGSYRMALAEYFRAYRASPDDPFVNFYVGELSLSHIHTLFIAHTKHTRHSAQALTFRMPWRTHASRASFQMGAPATHADVAGLGFLHQVMSRRLPNRHFHVVQAAAFLQQYARLRGCRAEAAYNLARAFQQLQLGHLAVPLYEEVLSLPGAPLAREAAYNLARLYCETGSPHLARHVLEHHLRV